MIAKALRFLLLTLLSYALFPAVSQAYIGPGLGLGVIGSVIGVFFTLFLAGIAVVWYPIKKLIRRMRKTESELSEADESRDPTGKP